jgi:hypothetical protein
VVWIEAEPDVAVDERPVGGKRLFGLVRVVERE